MTKFNGTFQSLFDLFFFFLAKFGTVDHWGLHQEMKTLSLT